MPEIKKTFLRGRMNQDLDERIIPNGEYRDASNIQVSSTEASDAGAIQNILGNKKLSLDNTYIENAISYLPFNENYECLGSVTDNENDNIYFLIKGKTNLDSNAIIQYNADDKKIYPILIDSRENKELNFGIEKITGIAIVENFLVFTDNANEPKIIDISFSIDSSDTTKYKNNSNFINTINNFTATTLVGTSAFEEQDITIIKKKPNSAPKVGFELSSDNSEITGLDRKFEDKFIRFAYRWKFKNNQYSVFSPFSEPVFFPSETNNYDIETGFNKQMVNNIKEPKLYGIEASLKDIEKVEILYKESNNANVYLYKKLSVSNATASSGISVKGESLFGTISENELLRHYDNVPFQAKALDSVGNRIIFGNYKDGLNADLDISFNSIAHFDRTKIVDSNTNDSTRPESLRGGRIAGGSSNAIEDKASVKTGRKYQLGVVLEDKYGRQSPVLTDTVTGFFEMDFDTGSEFGRKLKVKLNGSGADLDSRVERFKYYIKDASKEYYNVIVKDVYENEDDSGSTVWLVLPSYEVNKIDKEDFIILKKGINSNSIIGYNNEITEPGAGSPTNITVEDYKFKVLSVKDSKPDSLSSSKKFEDSFFVKIKNNAVIKEHLLKQQGAENTTSSGDLHILEDDFEGNYTGGGIEIGFYEDRDNRVTYYFKNGKVYEDEGSIVGSSPVSSSDSGADSAVSSSALCFTPTNTNNWYDSGISTYVDSTGTIADIYYRIGDSGYRYIAEVAICYASNSGAGGSGAVTDFSPAVFETIPEEDGLDIYYEASDSFHKDDWGNVIELNYVNCFVMGNGVESDRIRDDFNESTIGKGVRVSTVIDTTFKERTNLTGLIFSGIFNSETNLNELNKFNVANSITKVANPKHGSIQKLHGRDNDLIALCEDKILNIPVNKQILFNADGSENLAASNRVLGTERPYVGDYGISKNPESFAAQGYRMYFTDKSKGVVLRLSSAAGGGGNGLTVISTKGMTAYFRENLALETGNIIGSYDLYSNQYVLTLPTLGESVSFKEDVDGWVSRLSFIPENGISINGNYYTFKQGCLYLHHDPSEPYNKFYGDEYDSGIKLIFNQEASAIKNFKNLSYEGTTGWLVGSEEIITDQQKGEIVEFKEKEGKYFGLISGIEKELNSIPESELDSRLKDFSIQGLGNIKAHTGVQEFTCSTAVFNIADSDTTDSNGTPITALSKSTVGAGTLISVSAANNSANIQSGLETYTANIKAPNGYSNSGQTIQCTDTATGTVINPIFTCLTANFQVTAGIVGNATAGTVDAGTIASISPSTYQSGSTIYTATINIPASGYSNSGTIPCESTSTASAASCAFTLTAGSSYSSGNYTLEGNFSGTDYTNSDTVTLSVVQGNIGIGSAGSSSSVNTTKSALAGQLTIYTNQGVTVTATVTSGLCSGESATAQAPVQSATVVINGSGTAFTYDSVSLTALGSNITSYQWHKDTNSGFTPSDANKISNATSATLVTSENSADTIYYKVVVNGPITSAEHSVVYSNRNLIQNLKYQSGSPVNSAACSSSDEEDVYVKPANGTLTTATEFFSDIQGNKSNLQGTYSDGSNYRFVSSSGLPDPSQACTDPGGTQILGLKDCRNTISEIVVEVDLGNNNDLSVGNVISFTSNIGSNQYFYVNSIKSGGTSFGYQRVLANTHTSCLAVDPPTLSLTGTAIAFVNENVSLNASVSHMPQGASFTYVYKKSTDGGASFSDINTTTLQSITDVSASSVATTLKYKVAIQGTSIESSVKDVTINLYYQHVLKFGIDTGSINNGACTSSTNKTVFANEAPYGANNKIPGTVTQLYHTNTGLTSGFANGTYSDGDIHGYFNSNGQLINNWVNCPTPASASVEIQYPQGTSATSVNTDAYNTINLFALASNMLAGQTVNYTWTKNGSTVQGPNTDNTYGASLTSSEITGYTSPITHAYGVTASDGTNIVSDTINVTFTVVTQNLTARLCPNGATYNFTITNASGYANGQVLNLTGGGFTDGCYEITNASYSGNIDYSAQVVGPYPFTPSSSCCDCTGCSVSITDNTVAAAEVGDTVRFTASPSGYTATNYAFYTSSTSGSYSDTPDQTGPTPTFDLTPVSAGLIYVKVVATATGISREAETNQNWQLPATPVERFYQAQSYTSNCGNDDSIIEVRYTSLTALQVGTVFDTGGSICYRTTSSGSTSGNSSSYELQSVNFHDSCTACQNALSADCSFTLSRSGYDSTNGGVTVQATFGLGHTNTTSVSFSVSSGSVSPGTATKAQLQGNGVFLTLSPSVTLTGTINSSDSCNGTTDDVGIPQSTCNEIFAHVVTSNPATDSSAANELCGATLPLRVRVNGTSLATSTRVYSGAGCSTLMSGTKYYSQNNNQYYIWNGTSLSGPYTLNCP